LGRGLAPGRRAVGAPRHRVRPVERIGWRDQRGNSASIGLTDGGASFTGYAQHVNEGPIGYRGTAIEPAPPTGSLSDDLDQAVQALGRIAGTAADKLNSWLRSL
jgi:hypothetical protein